jgi:hypothetical protein
MSVKVRAHTGPLLNAAAACRFGSDTGETGSRHVGEREVGMGVQTDRVSGSFETSAKKAKDALGKNV